MLTSVLNTVPNVFLLGKIIATTLTIDYKITSESLITGVCIFPGYDIYFFLFFSLSHFWQ